MHVTCLTKVVDGRIGCSRCVENERVWDRLCV
jgi:hypothetical protein